MRYLWGSIQIKVKTDGCWSREGEWGEAVDGNWKDYFCCCSFHCNEEMNRVLTDNEISHLVLLHPLPSPFLRRGVKGGDMKEVGTTG